MVKSNKRGSLDKNKAQSVIFMCLKVVSSSIDLCTVCVNLLMSICKPSDDVFETTLASAIRIGRLKDKRTIKKKLAHIFKKTRARLVPLL